tara:strand:+ start:2801 stop:3556 length:756 start_codon:yes stop_codon:yes gene_type:complete
MKHKRTLDICLTPLMIPLFNMSNTKVVIIDVFRATSAMCVFLNNEGSKVIPVATTGEAKEYQNTFNEYGEKVLVAAERNGSIVPGFDLGNSPLSYHNQNFKNKSLVITTTNGTASIEKSKNAEKGMVLASFLNCNSIVNYLNNIEDNILIVCSGWKGRFCIEDLLLAGLLSKKIISKNSFSNHSDSILLAINMYDSAYPNLLSFLQSSSYMSRMNLQKDIEYCLQTNIMDIIPSWCVNNSNKGFFTNVDNI